MSYLMLGEIRRIDVLRELHWLPIRQRVEFKLGVIARKVIYTGTPGYLATAISRQQPTWSLRSSTAPLLHQPYAPSNFCKNSFSTAGNCPFFHSVESAAVFKSQHCYFNCF